MEPSVSPTRSPKRTYKLHGTLVSVDVPHRSIAIQPSKHNGTRVRCLIIRPDSVIIAGTERKVLADLIADVGEWVSAYYVKEDHDAVLKQLHLPRGMTSNPPTRSTEGGPATPTGCEPLPKAS
jgi:hypothetical protein